MTSDKSTVPRPLRADAVRNRAEILDVAEALLATEGRALSTEDVARRAGVGVGTVFRHFPTKEALLEAVVVSRLERLTQDANALAIDDRGEALFLFFERIVQQAARKRALTHALSVLGVDVAKLMREAGAEFRAAVGRLLARAQKQRGGFVTTSTSAMCSTCFSPWHTPRTRGPGKPARSVARSPSSSMAYGPSAGCDEAHPHADSLANIVARGCERDNAA